MRDVPDLDEAVGRFVDALGAIGVDYMITGSLACSLYGIPRMTRDADIVIDTVASDCPLMVKVLTEEFELDPESIANSYRDRAMFNVLRKHTLAKGDGASADRRAPHAQSEGDLSRGSGSGKLDWARSSHSELQLRDVHQLLGLHEIDAEYIRVRAMRRGLGAILKEAEDARYDA